MTDSQTEQSEKVCINCQKNTQKDAPRDSSSHQGQACEIPYSAVTECMSRNKGQISQCVGEWDTFKQCHEREKQMRQRR